MSNLVGCRLGDYQVMRRLGSGGMADVYAARQSSLQRDVALKVLRSVTPGDEESLKRFRREARAAARLNHPSIVQVFDFGESEGVHYIAQELVDGINLKQALDREGPFSIEQAVAVLQSVGGALENAHQSGVTHRDIKPENIMRGSNNVMKVTDFGLARMLTQMDASTANLTRAGLTLGTPRYMSPEQIQGGNVDARSDLYSLGVTMYHLLTGDPPYVAEEPLALAFKHLHETPRPLDHARGAADLPAWLVSLVMCCLQKNPQSRFDTASDLLRIVEAHTSAGLSVSLPEVSASNETANEKPAELIGFSSSEAGHKTSQEMEIAVASSASELRISSATLELQRVTDAIGGRRVADRRRRRVFQLVVLMASALSGVGAAVAAVWLKPESIGQELRGPLVTQAESIQQQYLIALTRDDIPAWRAVLAFPAPPGMPRSEYADKSRLQLARLLIEQHDYDAASDVLDELQQSGSVKRLYLLLALVHRHRIATETQNTREASRLKTQISDRLRELNVDHPAAGEMFRRVVPQSEQLSLGLLDT